MSLRSGGSGFAGLTGRAGSWLCALTGIVSGLALASAPVSALAHGGGGGGGRGVHYTVVTIAGRAGTTSLFLGQEAAMTLEITDAAPTAMDGLMTHGDIIARHTLRSSDAIVLLQPIKGQHGDVPAGAVLAKVLFASSNPNTVLWCDIHTPHRLFFPQMRDCFQDPAGAGKLTKVWQGNSLFHFLGFSTSGVGYPVNDVETPATYRPARPEERPTGSLGYKYCDGDGVSTPPRFAVVLSIQDPDGEFQMAGDCRFGLWPDPADKSKVQLDGLMVDIKPAGAGALQYHVTGRIPAEQLGSLRPDQPVQDLADAPSELALQQTRRLMLAQATLAPTGAPPKIVSGPVGIGQNFVSISLKHNITGVLLNRISSTAPLGGGGPVLEVGQPVFGVPDTLLPGDGMSWCAPTRKPEGGYETICLSPTGNDFLPRFTGYFWNAKAKPAMSPNPARLGWNGGGGVASSDPAIRLGPVNLPPMTLTVKLTEEASETANAGVLVYPVEMDLDWGEGPQMIARSDYELTPAGRVIQIAGVKMRLKSGADAAHLVVEAIP